MRYNYNRNLLKIRHFLFLLMILNFLMLPAKTNGKSDPEDYNIIINVDDKIEDVLNAEENLEKKPYKKLIRRMRENWESMIREQLLPASSKT
ncbi:MAG: hypothetical protein GY757_34365 [bacterium]|nr:hypothetical protein [bacterium]